MAKNRWESDELAPDRSPLIQMSDPVVMSPEFLASVKTVSYQPPQPAISPPNVHIHMHLGEPLDNRPRPYEMQTVEELGQEVALYLVVFLFVAAGVVGLLSCLWYLRFLR